MNISDFKTILEEAVHTKLYESSKFTKEQKRNYKEIKKYMRNTNNFIEDLRLIVSTRNNENYYAYDRYIIDFLVETSLDNKLLVLNNQDKYTDIIRNDNIYTELWDSLSLKEKIEYLESKKKYTNIDIKLINNSIKDSGNFKTNSILNEILTNEIIRNKIEPFSINLVYSYKLLSTINLYDFDVCNILTKDSYTKLLTKKCKKFEDFEELYNSNNKIYNLILNNSLLFKNGDNEQIYNFLLNNPNFIGKFNEKYLDLFNIMEITKISKLKTLDSDAFSAVMQKLYKYDPENASKYFSVENLKKCTKHSITIYPFEYMEEDKLEEIFNDYSLFNRFADTIMIEAINHRFNEDDIVSILRNDTFVEDMSSYAIELLLNKLSFKSTFNMLQRKAIFDKIKNLHVKVDIKDSIFFKGFLDSPILIYKSEHNMIYEMLNLLNKDDVTYFIALPYILNKLSNYEIINLVLNKDIKILEVVENDELYYKLNTTDIIELINRSFDKRVDLDIFKSAKLSKKLFNLSEEQVNNIDFDEVNYLFETIRMKSILSKQETKITTLSYKSVLTSYLLLGLEETLTLVNDGNKDVTLKDIKDLRNEIIGEKILLFKENNSSIFQNMAKKIVANLEEVGECEDLKDFASKVRHNSYLDNIVYLMLDNNFDTYNGIIDKLYGYVKYNEYDNYAAKKELYEYSKAFIDVYISNKAAEYNDEFEKIILLNFKPKENVIYAKRKEIGKEFLDSLKFKLFVRALTDPNKEIYYNYFRDGYPVENVKEKYLKFLANEEVEFDNILEHVLHPIVNNRFDKENCLNKLGIKKPKEADDYIKYLNDLKIVTELNTKINNYKRKYSLEETISIMNYICYGTKLGFKAKKKDLNKFDSLTNLVRELSGEIYVDKSALKYIYKDNLDIYHLDEIIEYTNYLEILDNIINKTYNYVNRNMDNEKVKSHFAHDYFKAINTDDCVFPITSKYYEPKKRVLALNDFEDVFKGYDLSNYKKIDGTLKEFLFDKKNFITVADGYYNGIVDNLGMIISRWDQIEEYIKDSGFNISNLSLISIENILSIINFEGNILSKSLDKNIINSICEDGYYEINDLNTRIDTLIELYKNSFKRVTSTVPYLCYKDDIYKVEVLDNYKQDILQNIKGSLYKVGAIGNDFLHYSILNKNGVQIGIYKENELIAKVLGVRNGNTLYLNALEGIHDNNYNELLRLFANELIRITKDDTEPIHFVTIVNNDVYANRNGLSLDTTLCPIISSPINKDYYDYEEFCKYERLINTHEIETNYEDNISTLLASDSIVDKDNFKCYDADAKYYRRRNDVIKLSNNIGEDYLNRIDTILYLCKLENHSIDINNITLSMIDTIYLGDDYVLFVTNKDNVLKFVLPYDERAAKEVDVLLGQL